uniref:V-type proton ATPase subunit d2-like n=1 Tax=Rhizophora mucronata TaxID=61149 RepID=A0A2P2LRX1_RHIMU
MFISSKSWKCSRRNKTEKQKNMITNSSIYKDNQMVQQQGFPLVILVNICIQMYMHTPNEFCSI